MVVSTISPTVNRRPHPAWLLAAALALLALGAAAAVVAMKWVPAEPGVAVPSADGRAASPGAAGLPAAPVPAAGERRAVARAAPLSTQPMSPSQPRQGAQAQPTAADPACPDCGIVEAVTPVQKKGDGTGVGAVVGGVLGGVVGHQMGGGRGKDAMTVIGAVGGGVAGHEVEKRSRATTLYQVRVRMADGTARTVTRSSAIALGQRVRLEGTRLVSIVGPAGPSSQAPAPRMQEAKTRS